MDTTTRPRSTRAAAVAALAVGAALLLGGCGTPDPVAAADAPPTPVEAVGRVTGTAALVAVVATGEGVVAYVCDGPAAEAERFFGTRTGDRAVLTAPSGAVLDLVLGAGRATGALVRDGARFAIDTVPAEAGSGLFLADGAVDGGVYSAGWVVLPDGTQTGVESDGRKRREAKRLEKRPVERPTREPVVSRPTRIVPDLAKVIDARQVRPIPEDLVRAKLCTADPARCPA
ncbi:hypothetical protein [Pseudonocardia sp.]|uniref:hypothetical protein n=1 Tax=Pseudonocardia sp. TaxID=60912 RepID=UPI003D121C31